MFDVNLIEDNDFMDKDVTQLNDDYYLFHVDDNDKVYFFHCGLVFVGNVIEDSVKDDWIHTEEYVQGTLQEYVDSIKTNTETDIKHIILKGDKYGVRYILL